MNSISDRFKTVRQNANMTQKEFGAAIGITQNMVSQIEKNSRAPSERTKMLVCKVFGITETWMDTGEGPMHTEPTEADEIAQLLQGASPTKALLLRIIASLPDRDLEGDAKRQALTLALQFIANTPNHIIASQLDLLTSILQPHS